MSHFQLRSEKICLRRPHVVNGNYARMGGSAYCDGNVCFGMGARGTHDPNKATCHSCLKKYHLEQAEQRVERETSIVDRVGELHQEGEETGGT